MKDVEGDEEGGVGLIPVSYVEEVSIVFFSLGSTEIGHTLAGRAIFAYHLYQANVQLPPINNTRALYAYTSTTSEELSMEEDASLQVFSIEEDWLMVRIEGGEDTLGFVPRTYCEPLDESNEVEVPDAAEAEADLEEQREQEAADARAREAAERQRQLKLKDKVETWSVSQVEGRKKKKGTLGVGNGAVFFASDTDKVSRELLFAQYKLIIVVSRQAVSYHRPRLCLFRLVQRDTIEPIYPLLSATPTLRLLRYRQSDLGQA